MPSNLYVSASGAMARLAQLDLVANNLANAGTTGYKRDGAFFESVLEASLTDEEGETIKGAPGLNFVRSQGISSNFEKGSIEKTGAPLDVAILGAGFLEVSTEQGPRYTRSGSLIVSAEGILVTRDGQPVMGDGGPIPISGSGIEIMPSGELRDGANNTVGRLRLVEFSDLSQLKKEGHQRYEAGGDAGMTTVAAPKFAPQSLEGSNVNSVHELGTLMILQRAFEANIQTLQADDEATASLIREFRG